MIRERFYLARRDDPEGAEVREVLRAGMGSLDLITPPRGVMKRRRTLASLLAVGALVVALAVSIFMGNVSILFLLYPAAFVVTAVINYFVQRWNLRSLVTGPGIQVRRVKVVEAHLGYLSHRLQVLADGEELELSMVGLRRRVAEVLSLGGYSSGPFR